MHTLRDMMIGQIKYVMNQISIMVNLLTTIVSKIVSTKLAIWNANCLFQHTEKHKTLLKKHNIDIMMKSETYCTRTC